MEGVIIMFKNKKETNFVNTINDLINVNQNRGNGNYSLICDLKKELEKVREEFKKEIEEKTNIKVIYVYEPWLQSKKYINYPITKLLSKLLKTLGYEMKYNYKTEEELFELTKIKKPK